MEVVFIALTIFAATLAFPQNNVDDDSGQYVPDSSGQYTPDDSGKYIPDHSGKYNSDGTGLYSGDPSGRYSGEASESYKSRNQKPYDNSFGATNLLGLGSSLNKQRTFYKKDHNQDSFFDNGKSDVFGNSAAASSQIGLPKRVSYNLPQPNALSAKYDQSNYANNGKWRIIRQDGDVESDGYHWEYETENGISAQESGKVHNKGSANEGMKAKGFYQYTGPDNVVIYTGYTADENGFVPVGAHLPTPPPTPVAILRALDYLKSTGKL